MKPLAWEDTHCCLMWPHRPGVFSPACPQPLSWFCGAGVAVEKGVSVWVDFQGPMW